jgi:hypothetical protein
LTNVVFDGNEATGDFSNEEDPHKGEGAGIFSTVKTTILTAGAKILLEDTTINVDSCTFSNNKAQVAAGGRFSGVSSKISGETLSGNSAWEYGDDLVDHCVHGEGLNADGTC